MEKKYTALRIIATGMKILAIIVGIITILAVCGILGAGASLGSEINRLTKSLGEGPSGWGSILGLAGSILAAILPIIIGGTIAVILYAGGEAINVQIDIESNTREMIDTLIELYSPPSSGPASLPVPQTIHPSPEPNQKIPNKLQITYCPQCGTKVDPSLKNCPACNYDLSMI
jgi:hypothetical protein